MQAELQRIIPQLKFLQTGPAWHGKSLEEALNALDYQLASQQVFPGSKSIWELVLHIIAWRKFGLEKLRQNESYQIEIGGPVDWPTPQEINAQSWKSCLADLRKSQEDLQKELTSKQDKVLAETVPGKAYTFYILLHGIVQHDAYHCGQVVLTRKMLEHTQA